MFRLTPLALVFTATTASAEIIIDNPRLVAAFGSARSAAAYMDIKNEGQTDTLTAAYSDASMVMLHETVDTDGVMKMQPVDNVVIPRFYVASLRPGGLHVMVMGLSPDDLAEETFPLTLVFENAGEVALDLPIQIGVDLEHVEGAPASDIDHGDGPTE